MNISNAPSASAETLQNKTMWFVLGSPPDGELLLAEIAAGESIVWTLHKRAAAGDEVIFYITGPISAVVAHGTIAAFPVYQGDPQQNWYKYYLGAVNALTPTKPVPMKLLRALFDEWRYLVMPRSNTQVPPEIVSPLKELLFDFD